MRVKFTEPYDYTPSEDRRVQVAFKPTGGPNGDGVYTVRRECGEAAIAAGQAEEVSAAMKGDEPGSSPRSGLFQRRPRKSADAEA